MKVSALIPAHNCEATIQATLDSVLAQTRRPDEILVIDDGSTDNTASILEFYKPQITVFRQPNSGVASARNALISRSQGDLTAFLDCDDIWHPKFLEVQQEVFEQNPAAALFFTGHVSFEGYGRFQWDRYLSNHHSGVELIEPLEFLRRYNHKTGPFACMSHCCIRRSALLDIGSEPFRLDGVEDSYLCTLIPVLGWFAVYNPTQLTAYRITSTSLSTNRLRAFGRWVEVFETLADRYAESGNAKLHREFKVAFASRRRAYAKLLMGANKIPEARAQLWRSLGNCYDPVSAGKSLGLLVSSYMPKSLQPAWPPSHREWKSPESA